MTALARRRSDTGLDTWHIYFGDVRIGAIGRCVGAPSAAPQWSWSCAHQQRRRRRPYQSCSSRTWRMKHVAERPYADPEAAARKLVALAAGATRLQYDRI